MDRQIVKPKKPGIETGVTYLDTQKGATIWLQKVTDEEYNSLKK